MASVDDIFKTDLAKSAGLSGKRKLEPAKDPNEIYKSSKRAADDSRRHARVQNGDDEEEAGPSPPADDDTEAGPGLPPQDDDDGDNGDDEEGRFFGGGISQQESRVLDYVDGAAAEADRVTDKIDIGWLRKTAANLDKHIAKNAELRAKFEAEPQKFIGSEADLDADIKGLSILSEHPALYPDFVKLGCAASLVGLLAHENTDIAIDAMEIVGELTDEDVSADDGHWNALADALVDADLLGLLVSNLSRLDEDDEADRHGVYHALAIMESLCSRPATATRIGQQDGLLPWLLRRIQRKESPVTQNKQYAAEIVAILAQSSTATRQAMADRDAVDTMLQLVAPYRNRDPESGGEEEEYMENLFEALTCLVDESFGKAKFVDAEGAELCLIMLKEGKRSKAPALRLLDHAVASRAGADTCVKLVNAGGLKAVFTLFAKTQDHRLLEHILSILASLLRLLPARTAERIRTLAKFIEKDYAKVAKLVKLHRDYSGRVERAAESYRVPADDPAEAEVELLSLRLDAGLCTLQQIDVSLAWLAAEDVGARQRIQQLLAERDEDLTTVAAVVREQLSSLDTTDEDNRDVSEMLGTLLEFLQ
ncbi:hypothetical protein DCS_05153 [Drechmeria coniospora]|uniref:Beta-catenin-like protein 1 N-terminal domain-containing protein n=1 Tax=Drechmeria coniospora TaxID=98403 RepID=A0A151GM10_DRECN|nr:hypothetical protein DCS_05153 [Drechmeria coniospora]KYK58140.1 hypothetical protein DCS_05153 [Drechmeria coniospora]